MSAFDPLSQAISTHPFPKEFARIPAVITKWIDQVVPCLAGSTPQSAKTTSAVIAHLRHRGVTDADIAAAMMKSGYTFDFQFGETHGVAIQMRFQKKPQQPNSMSPAEPVDPVRLKFKAQELDVKFSVAERAGNTEAMKEIAKALLDLLGKTGEAWHDMRKDKEKMDEVREEIMRNSPNIARNIRPFGPKEPPVPGPDGRIPVYRFSPPLRAPAVRR